MYNIFGFYKFKKIQLPLAYKKQKSDFIIKNNFSKKGIKKDINKILDKIFLRVLKKYPYKMNNIFLKIFKAPITMVIKFLSNTSNIMEDLTVIIKMPKIIFIKEIFKQNEFKKD